VKNVPEKSTGFTKIISVTFIILKYEHF